MKGQLGDGEREFAGSRGLRSSPAPGNPEVLRGKEAREPYVFPSNLFTWLSLFFLF